MERKNFLKSAALLSAGVVGLGGTLMASQKSGVKKSDTVYFHYLLFWLKKDISTEDARSFTTFFKELNKLPYVKNLRYGTPAASSPRTVLDNSFTYNVSMEFSSLAELEAYGKLPRHIELVKHYSQFFEKMAVHDSVYSK